MIEQALNVPLSGFTTLKVGGEAQRYCLPSNAEELTQLLDSLQSRGEPWHILGGGSNLLVSSQGVSGTVIRLTGINQVHNLGDGIIEAGTGVRLPHLARHAAQAGLAGLEFLVGVPGTVGGGIFMNAGAHGSCIAAVLDSAMVYSVSERTVTTLSNEQLGFAYRKSVLREDAQIVLSARFRLQQDQIEQITGRMQRNEDYRWRTQPLGFPSAGSTFKNPDPERGAGLLLEKAGAKQLRQGNAAVSAVHANFVINLGGASSGEVTTLLKRMQDCVYEEFQVVLQPEWKHMGEFSDQELQVWSNQTI